MRSIFFILLSNLLYLTSMHLCASQKTLHRADVGVYIVTWHRSYNKDDIGDIIEVYKSQTERNHKPSHLKRIYKYFASTNLDSVTMWHAPMQAYPMIRGILLTTSFSTGSGKEFIILAETKRGFHQVFKVFSAKIGDARSLEMVDLDDDSFPEIIVVPSYADFRESESGITRAQVWKWANNVERYVKIRESAYSDRLRPLAVQPATN